MWNMSTSADTLPRYPIYIISKSRWDSRLTSRTLEEMGVPYHIVVEPQEYDSYAAVIAPEKIYTLPFSNLGQGGIPARNWVWDHAQESGAYRHWIMDDNIRYFYRMTRGRRSVVKSGAIFRAMEDFVDRYQNVALAGPEYKSFAPWTSKAIQERPFRINTRIYSCILIRNDLPYRWRGRYNEDTDLSLRALKDGWCTVLFHAFLQGKQATLSMKGGNTDELYQGDGRLKMAQSLVEQHPDVTEISFKWGRYQHHVDYRPFRNNRLVLRDDAAVPHDANEYGMIETPAASQRVGSKSKKNGAAHAKETTHKRNVKGNKGQRRASG